jgi:uncharacterized membrane protein
MNTKLGSALVLLIASLFAACGGGDDSGDDGDDGDEAMNVTLSSGSKCTDTSLTYDNFGAEFLESYCTRCHGSSLSGTQRGGAPQSVNFDSLASAKKIGPFTIDKKAVVAGEDGPVMPPPDAPKPSTEERDQLGIWLACGMH